MLIVKKNLKNVFCLTAAVILLAVISSPSEAFFERELEELNRQNARRSLTSLERSIQTQIVQLELDEEELVKELEKEAKDKEEAKAEKEKEKESEESQGEEEDVDAEDVEKEKIETKDLKKPKEQDDQLRLGNVARDKLTTITELQMYHPTEDSPWNLLFDYSTSVVRKNNIFGDRIDPLPETEYKYSPKATVIKWYQGWQYQTSFSMSHFLHRHFPHNDRIDYAWNQALQKKGARLGISLANAYSKSGIRTEPSEGKVTTTKSTSYDGRVEWYISNKSTLGAGYSLGRLLYSNQNRKSLGTRSHNYDVTYAYRLSPKTQLKWGYEYNLNRPPKGIREDDVNTERFFIAADGRWMKKVFYAARASWKTIERKLETFPKDDDYEVDVAITYRCCAKTNLRFYGQRKQVETTTVTGSDPQNLLLGYNVSHKFSPKISINAGQSIRFIDGVSVSSAVDPDYPTDIITKVNDQLHYDTDVGLSYTVNPSLKLSLYYRYLDVSTDLKTNNRTEHETRIALNGKF